MIQIKYGIILATKNGTLIIIMQCIIDADTAIVLFEKSNLNILYRQTEENMTRAGIIIKFIKKKINLATEEIRVAGVLFI